MNQFGKTIGNNFEIQETIKALNGNIEEDVMETVTTLGSVIVSLASTEKDKEINIARISEVIKSGKALTKFRQMISAQGGDENYINNPDKFEKAENVLPVYSTKDGFISEIDTDIVGSISKFLKIVRSFDSDEIDNTAGIVFEKKVGSEVKVGEIVAYVYSNDKDRALRASQNLTDAFRISDFPIRRVSRILEVYGM